LPVSSPAPAARAITSVVPGGSDSLPAAGPGRPVALCTGLWTACADTPHALCAAWGYDCGNGRAMNSSGASACAYAVHRLCARNSRGRRGNPQTPEVIHTGDLTSYVTCQP